MLIETGYGLSPRLASKKGAGAIEYLHDVLASTCCDLDATVEDSYSGTGTTWANLTPSPADGAAQSDYDATNNGLVFTGTAGDPAAYWEPDDLAQYLSMPLNGVFNKMHRTDQVNGFWIARTFRYGGGSFASTFGSGSWNTDDIGISDWEGSDDVRVHHCDGSTRVTGTDGSTMSVGTDYISIVSFDFSQNTNNVKFWLSTTTGTIVNMSVGSTTTGSTEGFFGIFGTANEGSVKGWQATGSRLYSFAAGNELLDDTKAQAIIAHLEARHGRDYTP